MSVGTIETIEQGRDRYYALLVRFHAAQWRNDEALTDSIVDQLDSVWERHGKELERDIDAAWRDVHSCVSQWPSTGRATAKEPTP